MILTHFETPLLDEPSHGFSAETVDKAKIRQSEVRNCLLAEMSATDFSLIEPHLEPAWLDKGVLLPAGEQVASVHFLEDGTISILALGPRDQHIEVATVGREGVSGINVALGVDRSPHRTIVQIPGNAYRLRADCLRAALASSETLRLQLGAYAHALVVQIAETALANGLLNISERLARWILQCHDRLDGRDIPLTHDYLSRMLGVRRPGITNAMHVLEGLRIIRAKRGRISVLDRSGLELAAGRLKPASLPAARAA